MLLGCRLEFAADAGSLLPSISEVRTLLEQDRVRQALERADLLAQQHPGPQTDLAYAWALWRNGEMRGAETHFRRAAEAGLDEAYAGLALERASAGDWSAAVAMARRSLAADDAVGAAHGVLASAAWVGGDAGSAALEMSAWSDAERSGSRARAAQAMAAAASRLQGQPVQWTGEPVVVPVRRLAEGGWAVEAVLSGAPLLLGIDFNFRQSLLSREVVEAAGLPVDGPPGVSRAATARWPAILSPRQVAVPSLELDSLVLRNVVVAVAEAPPGLDGVIGADLLSAARWSLFASSAELIIGPPSRVSDVDSLTGSRQGPTVAWVKARVLREGLGAQMLLFPRVSDAIVAAGLDLRSSSRLDSDSFEVPPGSNTAPALLMLGAWKSEVRWRPASLAGWAIDGGVSPIAVLGSNVLGRWALHWYPSSYQFRIDGSPAAS